MCIDEWYIYIMINVCSMLVGRKKRNCVNNLIHVILGMFTLELMGAFQHACTVSCITGTEPNI